MIESAGNQINQSVVSRNNGRLKIEVKDSSVVSRKSNDVDADSVETSRSAESPNRPASEPITSQNEAFEIVQLTGNLLLGSSGDAEGAQANLNPDAVLELIA